MSSWVTKETEPVYTQLEALAIKPKVYKHSQDFNFKDSKIILNVQHTNALFIKSYLLFDKFSEPFIFSTLEEKTINLDTLGKKLNTSKLELATKSSNEPYHIDTKVVSPLESVKDVKQSVRFIFDSEFVSKYVNHKFFVQPLIDTVLLEMTLFDLMKFVRKTHLVEWVSIFSDTNDKQSTRESSKETLTPAKKTAQAQPGTESLGVTVKKAEQFGEWYTQVIIRGEMIDYYDVSGCYILRPNSFYMWEAVQQFMDSLFKEEGVQNAYFPIFVSKNKLETEKEHVEGFSPEVAWVTKYGTTDLAEPVAIRPTSETIIYPAYCRWIRSHRDLPFKLNQWCQVVRWEFKQPTPFIRTREFLWQEGHTAHATDEDAHSFMLKMLEIYKRTYEEILAVPVIEGYKSDTEKFAGAKMTSTIETFICENGRAVQAGTSHHLGTNFSKMFGITYEDRQGKKQLVHQTSWGYTTRSIGIAVMIHGDDKGMVMPPKAAPIQVVVIPIRYKDQDNQILKKCESIVEDLKKIKVRVTLDDRDNYTPGWKFNDWEKKGVCIRLEIGPQDMVQKTVCLVRRDTSAKCQVSSDNIVEKVVTLLEDIHMYLLEKARMRLEASIVRVTKFEDVMPIINKRKLIMVPWCEDPESEEQIKEATRQQTDTTAQLTPEEYESALTGPVKSICIPFKQPPLPKDAKCFYTKKPAKNWWLFGRSY